jgi:hypothetical protein
VMTGGLLLFYPHYIRLGLCGGLGWWFGGSGKS